MGWKLKGLQNALWGPSWGNWTMLQGDCALQVLRIGTERAGQRRLGQVYTEPNPSIWTVEDAAKPIGCFIYATSEWRASQMSASWTLRSKAKRTFQKGVRDESHNRGGNRGTATVSGRLFQGPDANERTEPSHISGTTDSPRGPLQTDRL